MTFVILFVSVFRRERNWESWLELLFTSSVVQKHNRYRHFIHVKIKHEIICDCLIIDRIYVDYPLCLQNVKAVFDAAIKVVLQPPKQKKKKKRKAHKACSILWFFKIIVLWTKHNQLAVLSFFSPSLFFSSFPSWRKKPTEVYSLNWLN